MPETEVEIRFLVDTIYETSGPKKGVTFKKDAQYKVPLAFAQRWIRRGKAELVDKPKPLDEVTMTKPPPEQEVPTSPSPAEKLFKQQQPETDAAPASRRPQRVLGTKDMPIGAGKPAAAPISE